MAIRHDATARRPRRPALSLIELLVVIAIIALVMSIMLPALVGMRGSVRSLECSSGMKSIAMEFSLFASSDAGISRGDSDALGPKRFHIDDFQDSLYGLDEFWDLGERTAGDLAGKSEIMLCPAASPDLVKLRGWPCSALPFRPVENVSLAMNMRLFRAEIEVAGQLVLAPWMATQVRSAILDRPYVPLVLDVDGAEAARRGLEPVYTAPPAGSGPRTPYGSGRYWMPSGRHAGRSNVAFVGGHVLSSADPAAENWDWSYQAQTQTD